jgi:RHS repeat-associated protein
LGRVQYGYDGEGRRVTKTDQTGSVVFVYDAQGRLVAEYGGYAGSGVQYVTTDHLGSTRIITDAAKTVVECSDFLPFGDEIVANARNGRSGIACYTVESSRQKFTAKERDSESRLDYFIARYYSWASGRFQSPDYWPDGTVDPHIGNPAYQSGSLPFADIADPQTHNQYVYVRNNPLRYTDPNGHVIDYLI